MGFSRNMLLTLVGVLALAAIVATGAYIYERDTRPSLEIRLNQNGLKIEGR